MTKKILVVFVSIMVVFGIVCTDAMAKKIFITMSTASTGGGWYPAGSNLAQLWNEKIPNIKANSQASKGSVQNVDLLRRKDVNLCWMQNNIARQSYHGTGRFKDKSHKNFRMVMVMFPSQYHILANKASGIKKIADIKGKRFIPGRPGSGNISSSAAVFGTFGFGHKDYKIDYAGQTEAVQAVQDGRVDGTFLVGGAPLGPRPGEDPVRDRSSPLTRGPTPADPCSKRLVYTGTVPREDAMNHEVIITCSVTGHVNRIV